MERRTFGKLLLGGLVATSVPGGAWAATRSGAYATAPPPDFGVLAPGSSQVLLVTTARYGVTRASVTGWSLDALGVWSRVLGPFDTAWIGGRGFAHPGSKTEGDLRSPTGAFPLPFAFGQSRPAGLRIPWRPVRYPFDYWVDDPRSRYYNAFVDRRVVGRAGVGRSNPLPRYAVAAGIGYNLRRVPGVGSALFLHPTHDSPTLGCVGLPLPQLTAALRWLRPGAEPRVVMGVGSELLRLAGRPLPTPSPPTAPPPTAPPPTASPDPQQPPSEPPPPDPTPSASPTPTSSPSPSLVPPLP